MAYTTINDPSKYFQVALYTGNQNANVAVVNDGNSDLQPDWVWGKNRDGDSNHWLFDSSRGTTKMIQSDQTNAEETQSGVTAFNSDGFTLGDWIGSTKTNEAYVAWQWKANGGTTTTNDASSTGVGTIDSVYQANTTAGFSIVTYTGTTSAGSIAHGLGAVPKMIIVKNRDDGAENWAVQSPTASDPWTDYMYLDLANAPDDNAGLWNDTAPTSTVFTIGTSGVVSQAENHVAYCFAEKQGYSKIGRYIGNGNADGSFVYTGFKPAWVMIKRASGSENWVIWDNQRDPFNNFYHVLLANASSAEDTTNAGSGGRYVGDFLSNGFKLRNTHDTSNSSSTYIYMAFAESPFVSSTGTPTTAR